MKLENELRIENVWKSFGNEDVLEDISLNIKTGTFTTLLAPTGDGKTTLLKIIAGVEDPDKGRIYFDDNDITGISPQNRSVSMVFQSFALYPNLNVYENIASPLEIKDKYSEEDIKQRVLEAAELLNIDELLQRGTGELSGGEAQRVGLARALVKDVDLILLDEPLTNLDLKLREKMREELIELFEKFEKTIIHATPDPVEARTLGTHVACINGGTVQQVGPSGEVYENPKNVTVGGYFSRPPMNIIETNYIEEDGKSYLEMPDGTRLKVGALKDKLSSDKYLIGIRPHNLSEDEGDVELNTTLELSEITESETILHLDYDGIGIRDLETSKIEKYKIGNKIKIFFDLDDVYVFDKKSEELMGKLG